jgi:hypothetical protein
MFFFAGSNIPLSLDGNGVNVSRDLYVGDELTVGDDLTVRENLEVDGDTILGDTSNTKNTIIKGNLKIPFGSNIEIAQYGYRSEMPNTNYSVPIKLPNGSTLNLVGYLS